MSPFCPSGLCIDGVGAGIVMSPDEIVAGVNGFHLPCRMGALGAHVKTDPLDMYPQLDGQIQQCGHFFQGASELLGEIHDSGIAAESHP